MNVRVCTEAHPLPDGEARLLGAVRTVTGAMTRVDTAGARLLVDCGVAQGRDADGWELPDAATGADAVVLTHGHNDHVGSLPELWRRGWDGPVLGTPATLAIARIVLADGLRLGGAAEDVEPFLRWLAGRAREVRYDAPARLDGWDGELALREAGHILGSASVELRTARSRVIVSGDIGRPGTPLIRDPHRGWATDPPADLVVMESTYGGRTHPEGTGDAVEGALLEAIRHAAEGKGHLLVPAFAIGRTQALLWHLNALVESGRVRELPVAVDTPMGLRVTDTYRRFERLYDAEAVGRLARGDDPLLFDDLYAVTRGRDSRRLRDVPGPMLVLAGSGMCTGGRIVGHLVDLLPRAETVLLFVGYQAPGTPGRAIQRAGTGGVVRLGGREVEIRARIQTISGLSAHADQGELLSWAGALPAPRVVALHHGEPGAQRALAGGLEAT